MKFMVGIVLSLEFMESTIGGVVLSLSQQVHNRAI